MATSSMNTDEFVALINQKEHLNADSEVFGYLMAICNVAVCVYGIDSQEYLIAENELNKLLGED